MPIHINIRHLAKGTVTLEGEVPLDELNLDNADELVKCHSPLKYDLTVDEAGDSLLVSGALEWTFECECARCLKPFSHTVYLSKWLCHLPMEGDDKVSVKCDIVDLTPYAREDMLLDLPQHPLCSEDCEGRKFPEQKSDLGDAEKATPWDVLDSLDLDKD